MQGAGGISATPHNYQTHRCLVRLLLVVLQLTLILVLGFLVLLVAEGQQEPGWVHGAREVREQRRRREGQHATPLRDADKHRARWVHVDGADTAQRPRLQPDIALQVVQASAKRRCDNRRHVQTHTVTLAVLRRVLSPSRPVGRSTRRLPCARCAGAAA